MLNAEVLHCELIWSCPLLVACRSICLIAADLTESCVCVCAKNLCDLAPLGISPNVDHAAEVCSMACCEYRLGILQSSMELEVGVPQWRVCRIGILSVVVGIKVKEHLIDALGIH